VLLAKGKSLHQSYLNSRDLPVLKELLYHCNLSKGHVEKWLGELLENSPRGKIRLSQLFVKLNEFDQFGKKICQPIALESAAIPYIESTLRGVGLTPKGVDHALGAARMAGGNLNLDKLVVILKEISNQQTTRTQVKMKQSPVHESPKKRGDGEVELPLPHRQKAGHISMEQVIAALEKVTGQGDEGNGLPHEVKAAIYKIVEKVVAGHDGNGPAPSFLPQSHFGVIDLASKEEMNKEEISVERERPSSTLKDKGGITSVGEQKTARSDHGRNVFFVSDLDAAQRLKGRANEGGDSVRSSNTRKTAMLHEGTRSTLSELIHTPKQDQKPVGDLLPAYVINQVGKQISRSVLKGDRVVRLRLKSAALGTVKVEMDMKENVLALGMITAPRSVRELLLSHVHELKDALMEHGLKIHRIDIHSNDHFGQSLGNLKDGSKEGPKKGTHGSMPYTEKAGHLSMEAVIAALEQVTDQGDKGNAFPHEVKAAIPKIMEKVLVDHDRNGPAPSFLPQSHLGVTDLASKEEMNKEGAPIERERRLSALEDKGGITSVGEQKTARSDHGRDMRFLSGLGGTQRLLKGPKEEGYIRSETKAIEMSDKGASATLSEVINTPEQGQKPVKDLLPAYVINQVEKQISRSVLKGDRVIKLRLKPPALGTVKVEMDVKENVLKLGMITEHRAVRELLLCHVHELRDALMEHGLKIEKIEIHSNDHFGQSLGSLRDGPKEGPKKDSRSSMPFITEDDTEGLLLVPRDGARGDHSLDLVA